MTTAPLRILLRFILMLFLLLPGRMRAVSPSPAANAVSLFDGTLDQWEGNPKLWRAQDGVIVGGSLTETIGENEFLCTKRQYTNFILHLKFKLTGTSGFINSGIQIRTHRIPNSK